MPSASAAWAVFLLFLIPFGGGIPGGVLLGHARGVPWPLMTVLYFLSDCVLACVFELIMRRILAASRKSEHLGRAIAALKQAVRNIVAMFGAGTGPVALILLAFGVDPMTARAAAAAAGHGFIAGWAIAIAGDMMYFAVIMASTLWLNSVLGDWMKSMAIVMAAMLFLPALVSRLRKKK